MEWIKLYTRKWIWGSGRTMHPEKRGVWIDLLALAGESKVRDGTLRHDIGQPMTRTWIANVLMLSEETLDACLLVFQRDFNIEDGQPRISIWDDGTIQITNWHKYQGKPEKTIAKQVGIAKAKDTRRRNDTATTALLRQVNELNVRLRTRRYEVTDNGEILDTQTGDIKTLEEFERARQGTVVQSVLIPGLTYQTVSKWVAILVVTPALVRIVWDIGRTEGVIYA